LSVGNDSLSVGNDSLSVGNDSLSVISCYAFKSNKEAGKMPTPQEEGKI